MNKKISKYSGHMCGDCPNCGHWRKAYFFEKTWFKIIFFTILFLIVLFVKADATSCPKGQQRITKVVDGDTFDVKEGRIRLLGIDAYDKQSVRMVKKQVIRTGYKTERVKKFGILATNYAEDMLLGKCVMLKSDYKDKGRYGRLLRYVSIEGMDFGSLVLERGLGNAYCGDRKIRRYEEYNELSEFKCKNNKEKK